MNTSTSPSTHKRKVYKRVQLHCDPDTGRTRQDQADECNINLIMAKFQKTGALSHVANTENNYGYASSLTFTQAMQTVATGERMFAELPSSLRSKFNGDPAEFLAFVQDPDNEGEMAELGLLNEDATRAYILAKKATEALLDTPDLVVDNDDPVSPTNPPAPPE